MRAVRSGASSAIDGSATWRSGDAAACKAVYAGSIPAVASINVKNHASQNAGNNGVLGRAWLICDGFHENLIQNTYNGLRTLTMVLRSVFTVDRVKNVVCRTAGTSRRMALAVLEGNRHETH